MKTRRDPSDLFEQHVERALFHEKRDELSLALREWKEAGRIRPRDLRIKKEVFRLEQILSDQSGVAQPVSAERFASMFNLGIRYWDRNMPSAGLKECAKALKELELLDLPTTCVRHNISVIKDMMNSSRADEQALRDDIAGKRKNNLPVNYKLATLYFDRRMLTTAEKHLVRCKEITQILYELESTKRSAAEVAKTSRECDSRCSSRRNSSICAEDSSEAYDVASFDRAYRKLQGINDDIAHVKELQNVYCTLTKEVRVLPCLLSRFTDNVSECEQWWTEIKSCNKLVWSP